MVKRYKKDAEDKHCLIKYLHGQITNIIQKVTYLYTDIYGIKRNHASHNRVYEMMGNGDSLMYALPDAHKTVQNTFVEVVLMLSCTNPVTRKNI